MGRGRVLLVIAGLAAATPACAPDLPRELRVDTHLTSDETALVVDAIDQANARLGIPRLGQPAIVYRGRHEDADGFHFDDLDDGASVVYAFDPASPEYRWLAQLNDRDYEGYATLGDVLVTVRLGAAASEAERRHFRRVVMHELGHLLGMPHDADRNSIMYAGADRLDLDTYTDVDQRDFCLVYGC